MAPVVAQAPCDGPRAPQAARHVALDIVLIALIKDWLSSASPYPLLRKHYQGNSHNLSLLGLLDHTL
jgi:hypothetical protein